MRILNQSLKFIELTASLLQMAIKEIQTAVQAGDLRNTQHLIDRREKAYVKDANQSNLLHTAAINGHTGAY